MARQRHEALIWSARRRDGLIDILAGDAISQTFPEPELHKWAAFYRNMAAKYRKPTYQKALDALAALEKSP